MRNIPIFHGQEWKIAIAIFVVVFAVYAFSPYIDTGDVDLFLPTAMNLVRKGNPSIDEYINLSKVSLDYRVVKVADHYYNNYPAGLTLMLVPFVFVVDHSTALINHVRNVPESAAAGSYLDRHIYKSGMLLGSLITAAAAIVIYLLSRCYLDVKKSLLVAGIFAFATPAWSIASRALWQHGPSILLLSSALYLLVRAEKNEKWVKYASIPLVYSYFTRPTNIIPGLVLTLFVFLRYRRRFPAYLLMGVPVLSVFLLYNYLVYGSLFPKYYQPYLFKGIHSFFTASLGHLFSPSRGIFFFSPILLLSIAGIYLKFSRKLITLLDYALLAILLIHWGLISFFPHWWGGHSYGPRLLCEMIPIFCYFLIPFFSNFQSLKWKRLLAVLTFLLLLASVFVHYRGAFDTEVHEWNSYPLNVDQHSERIWDLGDIQFLRGLDGK